MRSASVRLSRDEVDGMRSTKLLAPAPHEDVDPAHVSAHAIDEALEHGVTAEWPCRSFTRLK